MDKQCPILVTHHHGVTYLSEGEVIGNVFRSRHFGCPDRTDVLHPFTVSRKAHLSMATVPVTLLSAAGEISDFVHNDSSFFY